MVCFIGVKFIILRMKKRVIYILYKCYIFMVVFLDKGSIFNNFKGIKLFLGIFY